MIERHTCFYKVNNTPLYRSIIAEKNFDADMKDIGVLRRKITELADEEFEGVFDIDIDDHSNKGFDYFRARGIEFSYTRPSIVDKLGKKKEWKDTLDKLKQAVAV